MTYMKHKTIIIGLALCILVLAGALLFTITKQSLKIDIATIPTQSAAASVVKETVVATSTIKNFGGVYEALGQTVESYRFHTLDWVHIAHIEVNGKDLYVGETQGTFGNGVVDKNHTPLFLYDGILYTTYGYGGETYPLKETNWSYRYKTMDIDQYMPIENYGSVNMDREAIETLKIKVGLDKITIQSDTKGQPTKIEVSLLGQEEKISGEIASVRQLNLITKPEYAGVEDYMTLMNKSRRLPGNVTGAAVYELDMGYKISYPEKLNGKKVTVIDQGGHNYSFNTEDTPYEPDVAYLYCQENDNQQIGPRVGEPVAISLGSRSKLVDWGISQEYHSDAFSFTGPGYYCQFRVNQAFTLDMFRISF
jgi:hypothetical protein